MELRGSQRAEIAGVKDKQRITAVLCVSILGEFLPFQLIYKGTTQRCHPLFKFPLDWDTTDSKKHWSTEQTMLEYIENTVLLFVEARRESTY